MGAYRCQDCHRTGEFRENGTSCYECERLLEYNSLLCMNCSTGCEVCDKTFCKEHKDLIVKVDSTYACPDCREELI